MDAKTVVVMVAWSGVISAVRMDALSVVLWVASMDVMSVVVMAA